MYLSEMTKEERDMLAKKILAGIGALAIATTMASAAQFNWSWDASQGGVNNAGGAFSTINASFNTDTNRFVWDVVFSNQVTRGYTLAVNNGPNPKGHAGELAIIHFDASNLNAPKITSYAYNGQNAINSWIDGNGNVGGNQTPDLIHDALDTSWINAASVTDSGGSRRFLLDIDASVINGHTPLYPSGQNDWTGVEFGSLIGLWFHTFTGLSTTYGGQGQLCDWNYNQQGWFDASNIQTVIVPLPMGAWMGMAGLVGVGVIARKRRSAMKA
jgi:hypothetical protein